MLCTNCKINDATIHLYTNMNGKQQKVDLCHNCYQIMKTDPNNAILRGLGDLTNPNNMDPFNEFFNFMNKKQINKKFSNQSNVCKHT